jgi:hypothetical protein
MGYAGRYQQDRNLRDQPEYGPDWRLRMFHFARIAKAHPELADLDADRAFHQIERALRRGVPHDWDVWERFVGVDRDAALDEFPDAWDTVRAPVGSTPLAVAERLAL